jgi:hypothetical protein
MMRVGGQDGARARRRVAMAQCFAVAQCFAMASSFARARSLAVVALFGFLALAGGCAGGGSAGSGGVLGRPVVIGASVSAGGTSIGGMTPERVDPAEGGERPAAVHLGHAIDASFLPTHGQAKVIAERGMALDPNGSLERQVAECVELRPTIVFAVDAVFWAAYAPARSSDERVKRLERSLATLERVEAPMVIGLLPDMRNAVAAVLGPSAVVTEVERSDLNGRILAWAGRHPRVTLLALDQLIDDLRAGEAIDLGRAQVEARDAAGLLGRDGLHLTDQGQVALATLALSSLAARGAFPAEAIRGNLGESLVIARAMARDAARESSARASVADGAAIRQGSTEEQLALALECDAALTAGDEDRVVALLVERFSARRSVAREVLDRVALSRALLASPSLKERILAAATAAAEDALSPGASVVELGSAFEFTMSADLLELGDQLARRLAPHVAADRTPVMRAEVPGALGFALRGYDWYWSGAPAQATRAFDDVGRLMDFLEQRARSNATKFEMARVSGIKISLPTPRTPAEELTRLESVLRAAGRTADAEIVAARRLTLEP